jgi:hypothetical protein
MANLSPTGAVSFENAAELLENDGLTRSIVTVYGGARPHAISEYYGAGVGIPANGTITMGNIRGSTNQSYNGLSGNSNINEESLAGPGTICRITLECEGIDVGTTVTWNATGSTVSLDGSDLEYSLDGSTYNPLNISTGTLTVDEPNQRYRFWIKGIADGIDDPGEVFQFNIEQLDSNGLDTNSPSLSVTVNNDSVTPPDPDPYPDQTPFSLVRPYDGLGWGSDAADVSFTTRTFKVEEGNPEAYNYFNFKIVTNGFELRIAHPNIVLATTYITAYYNPSDAYISDVPGELTIPWIFQTGNIQPAEIMWRSSTVGLPDDATTGKFSIPLADFSSNVGAVPANDGPITAMRGNTTLNPDTWAAVSAGDSVQFIHSATGLFSLDVGQKIAFASLTAYRTIEFWARGSGNPNDPAPTLLLRILSKLECSDSLQDESL